MEENRYNQLKRYLITSNLPNDKKLAEQIIRQSKHFIILENQLYKRNKRNPRSYLKVLKTNKIEIILFTTYNYPTSGHLGTEKVFEKIRENYY